MQLFLYCTLQSVYILNVGSIKLFAVPNYVFEFCLSSMIYVAMLLNGAFVLVILAPFNSLFSREKNLPFALRQLRVQSYYVLKTLLDL